MKIWFSETQEIKKLLIEVEALRIVFDGLPEQKHIEENLRREALLKSSLFSARIEGNPLTLVQVNLMSQTTPKQDFVKLEIFNLLKAYNYIHSKRAPKNVSLKLICTLHKLVTNGISPDAGRFRKNPGAIFNQVGNAIYLAPPHFQILNLINELVTRCNNPVYPAPVNAAITHFSFEKIHPFSDGNGRVGRLILAYVLRREEYNFKGLISFEEWISDNRERYYQTLAPSGDATSFVEFFLESLINEARSILEKLKNVEEKPEDVLLPRRQEILRIVREHPYCSFDFMRRRFLQINPKTLHYDLAQLQKQKFVVKIGVSRGSVYKELTK
ncbi:Fic family protein [Candidatus Microgenomates bacterium]|nr:Fic family protein [Candidatus Microgenomates bacterium]